MLKPIAIAAQALYLLLCASPAVAQHFEILNGAGVISRQGRKYLAEPGVRILEGDIVFVPGQLQFLGDYGGFVGIQQGGLFQTILLRREGCGVRDLIGYRGRLSLVVRPRLCPTSTLQVLSLLTGGSYSFWGTGASLSDRGNASVIAVDHGAVATQNMGQTVVVSDGTGNIIEQGKPPGQAIALDNDLQLENVRFERTSTGIRIRAKVNPLNAVVVQGVEIALLRRELDTLVEYPILGNSLEISVLNPQGKERVYVWPLPLRRS
jgi:hypothetical protein